MSVTMSDAEKRLNAIISTSELTGLIMPSISRFFGIVIFMYYDVPRLRIFMPGTANTAHK